MNGIIPHPTEPIPVVAIPPFLAGLVMGLTKENHLEEIKTCGVGAETLLPELEFSMQRIRMGGKNNDIQALFELGIVVL
jgi:hypothetical protein